MKKIMMETTKIIISIILGIFLSVLLVTNQTIFAETYMNLVSDDERVTNLYFSIKPLDTWIYQEYSNSAMANFIGFSPANAIKLWSIELDGADTNKTSLLAEFKEDESYSLKNAPLYSYAKYIIKENPYTDLSIVSSNTTIEGQQTIKLIGVMLDKPDIQTKQFVGWKILYYLVQHDNKSYSFILFGDPKSFDKYVPEFEKMVKTIKWVDNNS